MDVDPLTAARRLLGAVVTARGVSARIVEVEAYGGPADGPWPDPAAHSHRGRTARNAVMFGPPGRLYTYRSHGIHVCANVSCGGDGTAGAVLLRAAFIESGRDSAQSRRGPAVDDAAAAPARRAVHGVHHGRLEPAAHLVGHGRRNRPR
jgi:DNA-3-methyladenine glycosylase